MNGIQSAASLLDRSELGGWRRFKWAFLWALSFGLATHLFMITNVFLNGDNLNFLYTDLSMMGNGRWLQTFACSLSTFYSLPWVDGLLALLWLSLATAIVIDLFDIRSKLGTIVGAACVMTFPTVASTLSYIYTADVYMMTVAMAAAAIWLTRRYKLGFAAGGLLLGAGLAIYQACLSFIMTASALLIILKILDSKVSRKVIFQDTGKLLVMGFIGLLTYFIGLKIALAVTGAKLSDYRGISDMGNVSLVKVMEGFKKAYVDFWDFATGGITVNADTITWWLAFTAFALLLLLGLYLFIKRKIYTDISKTVLLAALALLIPVCINNVYIVSPSTSYYFLMRLSWCLFFVALIALAERTSDELSEFSSTHASLRKKLAHAVLALSVAVCMLISYKYYLISNVGYYNMQQRYEKTYGTALRILDRAEQTEGYYPWIHTVMFGRLPSTSEPATGFATADVAALTGMSGDNLCINGYYTRKFIDNYLNVTLHVPPSEDVIKSIVASEEYAAMEPWPAATSTRVIDDVLVIKLSDNSEEYS